MDERRDEGNRRVRPAPVADPPRTRLRTLLAFGAAVFVLLLLLWAIGTDPLVRELATADLRIFALGPLAVLLALGCRIEALRRLLAASGTSIPLRRAFFAYGTGAFGRQVLPFGTVGGPAIMAYTLDRETGLGYDRTLAVVTVNQFLTQIASLVLALVGVAYLLAFAPHVPGLGLLRIGVPVVAVGLLASAAAFWTRRDAVAVVVRGVARLLQRTVGRLSARLEAALAPGRVGAELDRYYGTIDAVAGERRSILAAAGLVQVGWLLSAVPLYTGALALGVRLPVALVLFVAPVSGLAALVPLPGGLGGFEAVLAGILVVLTGLELASVAAIVVLYRLCSYWFVLLVGSVAVAYGATTVRELGAGSDE